ncbi:MAG: NERD domain-containing protein [Alphaproteobacteria bacterium]|nr:NERD domain-containing protein [Alphaproteobacteria bacterium]MBQ9234874.1 NERD domain-containing protein [Alphaproteobacteria bacterium]
MELILALFGIIIFILFAKFLDTNIPKIKGRIGERYVANILSQLNEDEYSVINDILLKYNDYSTQIDHVVVSIYGIFVIETKNYKGWITGYENSEKWYKNMFGYKYSFYNPIRQNKSHISALKRLLHIKNDNFISIVAFSDDCDLKVNTLTDVIYISDIFSTIMQYQDIKLTKLEVDKITDIINSADINLEEAEKEHITEVKSKIAYKEQLVNQGLCPKCGHHLVLRDGRYGRFIGCSNYPRCKFTQKY